MLMGTLSTIHTPEQYIPSKNVASLSYARPLQTGTKAARNGLWGHKAATRHTKEYCCCIRCNRNFSIAMRVAQPKPFVVQDATVIRMPQVAHSCLSASSAQQPHTAAARQSQGYLIAAIVEFDECNDGSDILLNVRHLALHCCLFAGQPLVVDRLHNRGSRCRYQVTLQELAHVSDPAA